MGSEESGTSSPRIRAISENDPLFQERRVLNLQKGEREKNHDIRFTTTFGDSVLERVNATDRFRDETLQELYGTTDRQKIIDQAVNSSRAQLPYLLSNPLFLTSFIHAVPEFFSRPLTNHEKSMEIPGVYDPRGHDIFDSSIISDQTYILILQKYREHVFNKSREFNSKIPEYKKEVIDSISGSHLIDFIDKDKVIDRLSNISYRLVDGLEMVLEERSGQFSPEDERVDVGSNYPDSKTRCILFHESIHALSGRTMVVNPVNISLGDESFLHEGIEDRRSGLWMQPAKDISNFFWLNEGVTESITVDLLHPHQRDIMYKDEQELLKLLLENGTQPISQDMLLRAFFEDYDPSKPAGERLPAWKEFYHAVNQAYAPGFLTRLDAYIQGHKGDTRVAVEQMKNDWRIIMDTETPAKKESRLKKVVSISPEERPATELVE